VHCPSLAVRWILLGLHTWSAAGARAQHAATANAGLKTLNRDPSQSPGALATAGLPEAAGVGGGWGVED